MTRSLNPVSSGVLACLFLLGSIASSNAEGNPPKDAEVKPDLSSPKSATLAWLDASWSGDASTVHKILVDDAKQREFVAGTLRVNAAFRTLEAEAIERFGEAGKKVTGYPVVSSKYFAKKITIEEQGDRATVSIKDAMFSLELRKIDGQWRVDLSEFIRDPDAQKLVRGSEAFAKLAEEFAREIKKGKHKSAEDAAAAFLEKRLALPEVKAHQYESDSPK